MIESNSSSNEKALQKATSVQTSQSTPYFNFEASYLGTMDFHRALHIQLSLGNLARENNQVSVLGVQHPTVITLGHRADEMAEILALQSGMTIPIVRTTRGGLATIHSEGQLVIYPIVNLKKYKLGVRDYVFLLLLTTQDLLKKYNIHSKIDLNGAGLHTEKGKIAFCGIQVHEGVTTHGLSLNVRNDLSLFSLIRACGVQNQQLDTCANYRVTDTLDEIFKNWVQCFKNQFLVLENNRRT